MPANEASDSNLVDQAGADALGRLRIDDVARLYSQAGRGLIAALFAAVILAAVQSQFIDRSVVYAWSAAFIGVWTLRVALALAYYRRRSATTHPGAWRALFVLGAVAAAAVWGSASVFLFSPASMVNQAFLALVLAGVAAGSVPVLAPSFATSFAFLSVSLLPLAGRLFTAGSEVQLAMAGLVVVFYLYLVSVAHWTHRALHTSAGLRGSNRHFGVYLDTIKQSSEPTNEELQREIAERRRIEEQLSKAKNEAEQASRSKGDFLAMISHEIRTPMNGVLGALELVKDMPLGGEQRELIMTAYRSTESLIGLINSVLDFSKIEVGRLELEELDFEVRTLVADVTGLLGKRAREKGLKIHSRFSPNTPYLLRGDPTRLRQILNNLVSNAVKFTTHGQVVVRVDVARQTPSHTHLLFEVEDTGIGISPVAQKELFQPFTQAESSMARKFGGTGLGLSISKQLVELMGGHIGLRSNPGKGSTFWFTLKLGRISPQSARNDLEGLKLLLLSTDTSVKDTLGHELTRRGASLEFAASEFDAVAKLESPVKIGKSWIYDGVIIDSEDRAQQVRPLASRIRSNSVLTGTVIVVLSTSPNEFDVADQLIDASFVKPVRARTIFDCLAALTTPALPSTLFAVGGVEESLRIDNLEQVEEIKQIKQLERMERAEHEEQEEQEEEEAQMRLEEPREQEVQARREQPREQEVQARREQPKEPKEQIEPPKRQQPIAPAAAPRAADPQAGQGLQGLVLLVEDNVVNQRIAKGVLERLGLSVELACDGLEAVEAMRNGSYELVLMDCQMPRMDGLQATEEIRRLEGETQRTRVPIIAVTANAMEGDRERCIAVGMDDYLAKPFKKEELRDKLTDWLKRRPVSAPVAERAPETAQTQQEVPEGPVTDSPIPPGDVLVVDDNAVSRKLTGAMLSRLGYRTKQAVNGREAVDAVQTERFDAILMDIEMPVLNGLEATQEIRQLEEARKSPRIPILALTGHMEPSDRERFLSSGMDDVLTKPIKKDTLASALSRHIPHTQTRGEKKAMNETESKATEARAIDQQTLSELKEVMGEDFAELLQAFLEDVPVQLYAIRDGIRAGEADAVRIAAHTLKSSAANLGAQALSAQSKELEMLAREGGLTGAIDLLKGMVEEFKRVRAELQGM